jgi:hypothetical protein
MPAASVHYMALHPKTNDLVIATHGRGIIIVDDISPLRQIHDGMLNEELYFLKSPPIVMWEESNLVDQVRQSPLWDQTQIGQPKSFTISKNDILLVP